MQDLVDRVSTAKKKISELIQHVDLETLKKDLSAAQTESENPALWDEPEKAQKLMKKINDLQAEISGWDQLSQKANDVMELAEMDDEAMREELEKEIKEIETECDKKEISTLLSGKFDRGNAILAIHAGAGGTEAHDWASMLQRMYLRWIESHGYESEIVDFTPGEEAGTKAKVEKMKRTAQGQQELLQLTLPQAMEDKKLSPRTAQALNNVASFYGVTA